MRPKQLTPNRFVLLLYTNFCYLTSNFNAKYFDTLFELKTQFEMYLNHNKWDKEMSSIHDKLEEHYFGQNYIENVVKVKPETFFRGSYIILTCHETNALDDLYSQLDSDWYNEMRTMALHHKCANLFKKLNTGRLNKIHTMPHYDVMLIATVCQTVQHSERDIYNNWEQLKRQFKVLQLCLSFQNSLYQAYFHAKLTNVLDLHYILDKMSMALSNVATLERSFLMSFDQQESIFDNFAIVYDDLAENLDTFKKWAREKKETGYQANWTTKKKFNVKWKLHLAGKVRNSSVKLEKK